MKVKKCLFSAAALNEFLKERIKKARYYKCFPDLCYLSAALVAEFVCRCKQAKGKVPTYPHPNIEEELVSRNSTVHEGHATMLPNNMRNGFRRSFHACLSVSAKYNEVQSAENNYIYEQLVCLLNQGSLLNRIATNAEAVNSSAKADGWKRVSPFFFESCENYLVLFLIPRTLFQKVFKFLEFLNQLILCFMFWEILTEKDFSLEMDWTRIKMIFKQQMWGKFFLILYLLKFEQ